VSSGAHTIPLPLASQTTSPAVYCSRNPRLSPLFRLVEDYAEEYERGYEERFAHEFGPWRPHVGDVLARFLACGDLHHGFARVHCDTCGHEYLLAFSCKAYCFCPSCHQKRALLFGEWRDAEVLGPVIHRQYVMTTPKVLRGLFRREPRLLGLLGQAAWLAIKAFFSDALADKALVPGAVMVVQSYGDMVNANAHVHALVTEGAFAADGTFKPLPLGTDLGLLTELFRQYVFRALREARRISDTTIQRLLSWTHSGFNCHRGNHLQAEDFAGRQQVARYLLHPPLSLERMTYDDETGEVTYRSHRQHRLEKFDPLDWLARVASHIPEKGSQMVRYFGAYSNKTRGMRKKAESLEQPLPPSAELPEPRAPPAARKSWARLLAAVWNADPLECPRCGSPLRILGAIYDPVVIHKILRHLGKWNVPVRAPPRNLRRDNDPSDVEDVFAYHGAADCWSDEWARAQKSEQPWQGANLDVTEPVAGEEAPDPYLDTWPDADPDWVD